MNGPRVNFILRDDDASTDEEDMPELPLTMKRGKVARLEVNEIHRTRPENVSIAQESSSTLGKLLGLLTLAHLSFENQGLCVLDCWLHRSPLSSRFELCE